MYVVPEEYYFRIHHVRPRFKNDIENVLIYMATEIARLPLLPNSIFTERINQVIGLYPGNAQKKIKTINNWRTEISALFGYMVSDENMTEPGLRAIELSEDQDLVKAFKIFLYNFQYPGAHIKAHEILKMVEKGVHFKPAQYILKLMKTAETITGKRIGFTKAEITHCVLNDLRCTRDNEDVENTWYRINQNRRDKIKYDQAGDVIRYGGDILDYMEIANLLVSYDNKRYYINTLENMAVHKFINSKEWFACYDKFIESRSATLDDINNCKNSWFAYVNREIEQTDFETDILAFISNNERDYDELKHMSFELFEKRLDSQTDMQSKDIGDMGESLVHSHECERVKEGGRRDLVHLIQRIPTKFAVGYDIQSVELDEKKRYIEVKTTISLKPLSFNRIHLTPNEWNTAESLTDRYFVYRLMISKRERKLFILQDPVGLYKKDVIKMVPKDGADVLFDPSTAGDFEELLAWRN